MGDSDEDWDDDDGFGEDEGADWGDMLGEDDFVPSSSVPEKSEPEPMDVDQEWTCLECNEVNTRLGLMCMHCGKRNVAEHDRQLRIEDAKKVEKYFEIFQSVHIQLRNHRQGLSGNFDRRTVENAINTIAIDSIPAVDRDLETENRRAPPHDSGQCQICFTEFEEKDEEAQCVRLNCHAMSCRGCFKTYIVTRLADDDILPFIPCPDEECIKAIQVQALIANMSVLQMFQFADTFCKKMLARNRYWVLCGTSQCGYGWIVKDTDPDEQQLECDICGELQTVKKKSVKDEGFLEMLKDGTIRLCPSCEHPHMKDKGICNVMQCIKCNIWWNWQTRETGNTQRELKNKARSQGSLWEPGELDYQQRLEREDPEAFRQLLERNGISYDPNYVRGS